MYPSWCIRAFRQAFKQTMKLMVSSSEKVPPTSHCRLSSRKRDPELSDVYKKISELYNKNVKEGAWILIGKCLVLWYIMRLMVFRIIYHKIRELGKTRQSKGTLFVSCKFRTMLHALHVSFLTLFAHFYKRPRCEKYFLKLWCRDQNGFPAVIIESNRKKFLPTITCLKGNAFPIAARDFYYSSSRNLSQVKYTCLFVVKNTWL